MKTTTIKTLLVLTIFFFQLLSCSPTRKMTCSDKEKVTPYKDPAQSFPVYTKQFDHTINATLNIIDEIKLSSNLTLKNKIVEFREKLDQRSSIIQDLIKQNVIYFNNAMCYKDVRESFQKFQTYLTSKIFQINQLNEELSKISESKSKEDEEKILENIQQIDTHVKSIQDIYNSIYPSSAILLPSEQPIKLFIKYHDKYIDNSNLLFNGMIKALNDNKNVKFEYFYKEADLKKSDFMMVISNNALNASSVLDNSCDYTYNFSLVKKNSVTGEFINISSEQIKSNYCKELAREEDVVSKFKNVSNSLIQTLVSK